MKRTALIGLLCLLLSGLLVGWAWAQGEGDATTVGQTPAEETAGEAAFEEPTMPYRDWGDYRYIFTGVAPSADLDLQSVIMNWFTPDLYNANWNHANYVHLRVSVQWHRNERSLDYMPLQLILHSGGRSFILFGKNNATQSYLWRRGNHYGNDVGARYPDHVGDDAKVIFTFDTNGAVIDPYNSYIEVRGILEVWDWNSRSQLYVDKALGDHYWYRYGSSYFTYTPLGSIPLAELLPK